MNVIWRSHVHQLSQSLTVHLSVIFLPEFFVDQDASYSPVKYFTGIFTGSDASEMNFQTEGSSRCALIRQGCCHGWGMSSCLEVICWVFARTHTHTYRRAHTLPVCHESPCSADTPPIFPSCLWLQGVPGDLLGAAVSSFECFNFATDCCHITGRGRLRASR